MSFQLQALTFLLAFSGEEPLAHWRPVDDLKGRRFYFPFAICSWNDLVPLNYAGWQVDSLAIGWIRHGHGWAAVRVHQTRLLGDVSRFDLGVTPPMRAKCIIVKWVNAPSTDYKVT
ncbi:hypothetical protein EDB86DRAFT_2832087 [Lactarius hatsudake]|nr:hypothetical protein EDB86DRAFT_2832087 [Lactarius hatsudake]